MIKYTKNVLWLEDYVQCVNNLIPLDKVRSIKGYKVKLGLVEKQDAAIHINKRGDKFNITIKLYDQEIVDNKLRHVPIELARVLDSLAHELAHVMPGAWDHSPEHLKLQSQILHRFYRVLKQKKIEDTWMRWNKLV